MYLIRNISVHGNHKVVNWLTQETRADTLSHHDLIGCMHLRGYMLGMIPARHRTSVAAKELNQNSQRHGDLRGEQLDRRPPR